MKVEYIKKSGNYLVTYTCKCCKKTRSSICGGKKRSYSHSQYCRNCIKNKAVIFKNFITDEIISANSITNFCERAQLGKNAKYHFAEVLSGKRLHYKGWGLTNNKVDKKKVKIIKQYVIKPAIIE